MSVNYAEVLVKAKRYEKMAESVAVQEQEKIEVLDKDNNVINKPAIKDHVKGAAAFVGKHKKAVGIGAGALAVGASAAIAAKKIHDKKKAAAQNQEQVKENYEYDEYAGLLEAVINGFMSEEEIMSENANEIAIATADYMIKNVDSLF